MAPLLPDAMEVSLHQPRIARETCIFPYHPSNFSSIFSRACTTLQIGDLRFHNLRHEGINQLFHRGMPIADGIDQPPPGRKATRAAHAGQARTRTRTLQTPLTASKQWQTGRVGYHDGKTALPTKGYPVFHAVRMLECWAGNGPLAVEVIGHIVGVEPYPLALLAIRESESTQRNLVISRFRVEADCITNLVQCEQDASFDLRVRKNVKLAITNLPASR